MNECAYIPAVFDAYAFINPHSNDFEYVVATATLQKELIAREHGVIKTMNQPEFQSYFGNQQQNADQQVTSAGGTNAAIHQAFPDSTTYNHLMGMDGKTPNYQQAQLSNSQWPTVNTDIHEQHQSPQITNCNAGYLPNVNSLLPSNQQPIEQWPMPNFLNSESAFSNVISSLSTWPESSEFMH